MKIAILSDIHGNYEALSSFREIYDQLWVLGDLVNYGPNPCEVVEWVRTNASVIVRGNHDHALGFGEDPRCTTRYRAMAEAMQRYTASVLTDEQKQFLRGLPLHSETVADGHRFYLCHAIPSDPLFGYCEPQSDRWSAETEQLAADVLLVGHTHLAFTRQLTRCLLANPGSLGQPKTGAPESRYAVWENGELELRSSSYPVDKTIAKIERLQLPVDVREDLSTVLRTGSLT